MAEMISTEPTNTQAALAAEISDRPAFAQRLSVGSRIDNGAQVLRSHLIAKHSETYPRYDVLALTSDGEFVTWRVMVSPDGRSDAYWGHYFGGNLPEALADYVARSGDSEEG